MRAITTVLVALLVAGCSGSQGGDTVTRGDASVTGNGYKLSDLNNPANPTPSPDQDIEVTGLSVLAVDNYDETKDGKSQGDIYVEDLVDPKATTDTLADGWHGVEVFAPSFNPPDLRVAPGDVVDIRGRYQLFAGPSTYPFPTLTVDGGTVQEVLPELVGGTISLRFEYKVPDPVTIDVNDLGNYFTGHKWLGMLVKVENVTLAAAGKADTKGRYSAQLTATVDKTVGAPTVTNALFDLGDAKLPMAAGTKYKSIVGIVQYFQNYSIAPRSAQDFTQ